MRIGVIGAGMVGGTLGQQWAKRGHQVMFGVREGSKRDIATLLSKAGPSARAGTVAEAAASGEVVLLATPWNGTQDALRRAGDLKGKILLDATNPLSRGPSGMTLTPGISGGEQVAAWVPGANVIKIFNSIGFDGMRDSRFGAEAATMFYCGDDASAKGMAAQLATELGFETVDVGPLAQSRLLEALALLWVQLAMVQGQGREIAFKLLRR